jgi:hypothetical protein
MVTHSGHRQWSYYQLLRYGKVLLVLLGCLRQQRLKVAICASVFYVHEGFAGETAIKLMYEELEILR